MELRPSLGYFVMKGVIEHVDDLFGAYVNLTLELECHATKDADMLE